MLQNQRREITERKQKVQLAADLLSTLRSMHTRVRINTLSSCWFSPGRNELNSHVRFAFWIETSCSRVRPLLMGKHEYAIWDAALREREPSWCWCNQMSERHPAITAATAEPEQRSPPETSPATPAPWCTESSVWNYVWVRVYAIRRECSWGAFKCRRKQPEQIYRGRRQIKQPPCWIKRENKTQWAK